MDTVEFSGIGFVSGLREKGGEGERGEAGQQEEMDSRRREFAID